jgi:uncharacterized protein GlcG (DUF336 family)
MDLETANRVIAGCIEKATEMGKSLCVVVVDEGGNPVAFQRMDGAHYLTPGLATGKAYACAALGRTGTELAERTKNNPGWVAALVGVSDGRVVLAPGGAPLILNGRVIGAVGTSGGRPEEDQEIASAGAAAAGLAG